MSQCKEQIDSEALLVTAEAVTDRGAEWTAPAADGKSQPRVADEASLFDNPIGVLSVEQLAGILGFAPKTIRNWCAKREIPFVRLGGNTYFRLESIEAWLKKKEQKPWR